TQAAGGIIQYVGGAVTALGTGVGGGLGQLGATKDPVGVKVASTGGVVNQLGGAVTQTGNLVTSLSSGPLSPLAPVTGAVGGLVTQVG
ncbi:collagen-like triple helix repeat-containing protein, partial [Rhizobium sp. SIMBA_035]